MGATRIIPAAPLSTLIESIWDWDCAPSTHRFERILPVPAAALIINLQEDETRVYADAEGRMCTRSPGSIFSGPYTRSFVIDTAEQVRVMGVVFRPGGAACLFRERMDPLRNRDIGLEDLAGRSARRLRQRLLETAQPRRRLLLLEQWLRTRAADAKPHPAVASALDALRHVGQVERIAALVAASGFSHRRFGAIFLEQVGMSAKRYLRQRRFHAVVAAVHRQRRVDWAAIAADCGYCDQPHLVREFSAFAGMTPSAYMARQGLYANHIPLD